MKVIRSYQGEKQVRLQIKVHITVHVARHIYARKEEKKMKFNKLRKQNIERQIPWQQTKQVKLFSDLPRLKRERI